MTNEPLPEPPPGKPLEPPPPGALKRPPLSSRITWKGKVGFAVLALIVVVVYVVFFGDRPYEDVVGDNIGLVIIVLAIGGAVLYSATHHRKQR